MVPKCHFISVRSTQHTVVIHSNITFHTLEPTRKCVLRKDLKQRRSTMTHEMKQKQRDAEKLQYSTKTTEMKQKKHDAEKLRRSTMTSEMKQKKHNAEILCRQNKADAALSPQSKSKAQELRQASSAVLSPQSKRNLDDAEQAWLCREKTPQEVEQNLQSMAVMSNRGNTMCSQVIVEEVLRAQQWLQQSHCVTERES